MTSRAWRIHLIRPELRKIRRSRLEYKNEPSLPFLSPARRGKKREDNGAGPAARPSLTARATPRALHNLTAAARGSTDGGASIAYHRSVRVSRLFNGDPTPGTGVATRRHRKCPVRAHPTFAANAIVTNDREPDQ